ncbi:MAG: glycosidase, partial [Phycisphaerales bacterium]|nr:glycosidase [Phycisphaerales bacterium]
MCLQRYKENPLIRPADVPPWQKDFRVVGVFNAGCVQVAGEILLLLRVAESPPCGHDEVVAPILRMNAPCGKLDLLRVSRSDPDFEDIDSRVFRYGGQTYLTSISHLRIARSRDGRIFSIDPSPALHPETPDEEFGVEDPRITRIDGHYYVNYTAVSRRGITTALAVTEDFRMFRRRGLIFAPENRDVTIFPERISDQYICYHRPSAGILGDSAIWLARSNDLIHWGDHAWVCGPRGAQGWDSLKIGGGAVPIKTSSGWLAIYHGVDADQRYCLGALLTDLHHPGRVIARSEKPILEPWAPYERQGFFGQVVFT